MSKLNIPSSVNAIQKKAKTFTLPGFNGFSVYYIVRLFLKELGNNTIITRAQAIAFSFFLSLFPAILFAFTIIPYLPFKGLSAYVIELLSTVFPDQSSLAVVRESIEEVINEPRFGMMSLGFFAALYLVSNGVMTMIRSFDKSTSIFKKRNFIQNRAVSLSLTFILTILFLLCVFAIFVGDYLMEYFNEKVLFLDSFSAFLLQDLRYAIIFFLFLYSISAIYYFGPPVKTKWKFITPGSIMATILIILITAGFSYYIRNFGQYNKLYGSLATIIILQVWFYLNALVLLAGFELNVVIHHEKSLRNTSEA